MLEAGPQEKGLGSKEDPGDDDGSKRWSFQDFRISDHSLCPPQRSN